VKMQSRWRAQAAEVISEVVANCEMEGGNITTPEGEKALRARLREAYPFGERQYYPYKVWLDEIARQIGKKWPIGHKLAWMNNQKRAKGERIKMAEWEKLYGANSVREPIGKDGPSPSRTRNESGKP
jgi:hypothetical protein